MVKDVPASLLEDLDVGQKRELICEEMENVRKAATREARVLLGALWSSLVLFFL